MKLLNPDFQTQKVTIDWSKPVIQFDPWPFADSAVNLTHDTHYWLCNGELIARGAAPGNETISALVESTSFLATATDGKYVVGNVGDLRQAGG